MFPNLLKTKTPNLHLRVCYAWKSLGGNAQQVAEGLLAGGEVDGFHFILYTPLKYGKIFKPISIY